MGHYDAPFRDPRFRRFGVAPREPWGADPHRPSREAPAPAPPAPPPRPVAAPVSPPPAREDAPAPEKEQLRSALRDLEATTARVQKNAARIYDETRAKLIGDLLPVLDNLDRTIDAGQTTPSALLEGVAMVRAQMEQVLVGYGVEPIDAEGARFDPKVHEAIATAPAGAERVGQVVQQVSRGYRFAGRVLRPAKVIVGAA